MTTQHPEALRLAEELDDGYPLTGDAISAAAELRSQHARITELESQLAQRFDAADVATAAAQGFRDGVASVSAGPDDIDAVALARYKVVPAHESMFHRFAVVAGDGKRQLYLGREIECANMARKFAGAFLDGAFYQSNIAPTPPAQAADSVQEDAARYRHLRDCNSGSLAVMQITGTDEDDWFILTEDDADAAIDAARKQGGAT